MNIVIPEASTTRSASSPKRAFASRKAARRGRLATALLVSATMLASVLTITAAPASAATPLPDGTTTATAAASCWEIKQNYPASADGIYWLLTPALKAPQQFYCDQTTDGGGWVLIGRGREGWKGQYNGLRTPAVLRNTVSGTGAFLTAQLPGTTVNALLNGTRVDALTDRVRIRRATNREGTTWQEARFAFQNRDRWVWTLSAVHLVGGYSFDGVTGSGGRTNNFGRDNAYQRVDANSTQAQGWTWGLAYGGSVAGSPAATSYLYSATEGAGSARPFTQMYLRPHLVLSELDFGTIPDAGAPAETLTALPESDAIRTVWGVTGQGNGSDGELNTEVAAFAQVGNTVYVGGNFRYVQKTSTSTGADKIEQKFLAGFNVDTGEWVSSFRPTLNGQVKGLAALPDGRLAVGGQFSTANGSAQQALVMLDPVTGATSGSQVALENRTSGGVAALRGITVLGSKLYLAGSFTHLTAAGKSTAYAWNGARIETSTGTPDTNWNPLFNGTSVGVDASATGDRTYFSGYFRQSGSVPAYSAAAVQTASGAALVSPTWTPTFSKSGANYSGNIWQLGVREAGGKVWLGGSEHSLFAYDRDDFSLDAGNITNNGGDFQVVTSAGNTVFGGCHCGDWTYSNAFTWSDVGTNFTQADKISLFGAWNATTGAYLQEFSPILQARKGYGVWGIFVDSRGTLWAGGDLDHSVRAGEVNQWVGGFTRFAARDTNAPTKPGNFSANTGTSTSTLSWSASSDNRAVTAYEILRGNKVIATTTALNYAVPVSDTTERYFVRAADAAGNRSETTAVATVSPAPPTPEQVALIANNADWRYRFDTTAWPADWRTLAFDDSAWLQGAAPLGFGNATLATDVNAAAPSPKPLSTQYRRSFTVTDAATLDSASLSVIADDGVVVYVNGTEVGRTNLPTGNLSQTSYATAAPRTTAAGNARVTYTVPVSLLVEGTNVVAVSTHSNYRATPDSSFNLSLSAVRE